jgi:Autophagocytosis associated protein, active-site domain
MPFDRSLLRRESWEASALQYEIIVMFSMTALFADSSQNHPITDLPAFFIHPCNTAQALEEICQEKPRSPEAYLLVWFGLVGPLVDLYMPSQLSFAIMQK